MNTRVKAFCFTLLSTLIILSTGVAFGQSSDNSFQEIIDESIDNIDVKNQLEDEARVHTQDLDHTELETLIDYLKSKENLSQEERILLTSAEDELSKFQLDNLALIGLVVGVIALIVGVITSKNAFYSAEIFLNAILKSLGVVCIVVSIGWLIYRLLF